MASALKTIEATVDTKKLSPDKLYIDSKAMETIKNNIVKDMELMQAAFENIAKISKKAVTKQAVFDSEEKVIKEVASIATKRANACKNQNTLMKSKIKASVDAYKLQLLENRVAELEAALQKLLAANK